MFNVFSDSKLKMSKQIKMLQKCAGSEFNRLLFAGPIDEPLYMLHPKVIHILTWVNTNILFELPKVKDYKKDAQWIGVRIRIATSMLNKCDIYIPRITCIDYHTRMTSRIRKILSEICVEDLPF